MEWYKKLGIMMARVTCVCAVVFFAIFFVALFGWAAVHSTVTCVTMLLLVFLVPLGIAAWPQDGEDTDLS